MHQKIRADKRAASLLAIVMVGVQRIQQMLPSSLPLPTSRNWSTAVRYPADNNKPAFVPTACPFRCRRAMAFAASHPAASAHPGTLPRSAAYRGRQSSFRWQPSAGSARSALDPDDPRSTQAPLCRSSSSASLKLINKRDPSLIQLGREAQHAARSPARRRYSK